MRHIKVKLRIRKDAVLKYFKARPIPFALKESVGQELNRLEQMGVLEKVAYSEWVAPVVPVPKPNGSMRLCGDYKTTVNQALEPEKYPLPKPEDLFTALTGGQRFSKLDLKEAYLQLELEDESRKYVTLNTHQGLYQFTRVPYGISTAPTMFQKIMDTLLQGKKGVICYLDDILVTGENDDEHLENLAEVFKVLKDHGIRVKKDKCEYLQKEVQFLGYKIQAEGNPRKTEAIRTAPIPRDQRQLKSFLGLIQYYGKFIRNLSSILQPLNQLLQQNNKWNWSKNCEAAFLTS